MSSFHRQLLIGAVMALCVSLAFAAGPPCNFNQYNAAGTCTSCPSGGTDPAPYYSAGGSQTGCGCPNGFNRAAGDANSCGACTAGYYNAASPNSFTPSTADQTYGATAASVVNGLCTACSSVNREQATSGATGASTCGACSVGFYGAATTGTSGCVACSSLQRANTAAVNSCGACNAGYYSPDATTTSTCLSCNTTLNRQNGGTAGTCGACNAGYIGSSNTTEACVTNAAYAATCAGRNRILGSAYPSCGTCIAGAAGSNDTTTSCTACGANTYPNGTSCQSCTTLSAARGPACTACNTTSGRCTSCPTDSFPPAGSGFGCEYKCPNNTAPTTAGTFYPCTSCLVSGCTACNATGYCGQCQSGYSLINTAFGGCLQNTGTITGPVNNAANGGFLNSTQSIALLAIINSRLADVADPNAVAQQLAAGFPVNSISGDPSSPAALFVAAIGAGLTTGVNVTLSGTINGQPVSFTFLLTSTPTGGLIVSGVVANPALSSNPADQLPNLIISSISVTPTFNTFTPVTTANKMRRLSVSTQAAAPAGTLLTLTFVGAVPAGRTVWCARVLSGQTFYQNYEIATSVGGNQYTCNVNQPDGATYALVTLPTSVSAASTGITVMPASYTNYHTDVGLGVGLGVGIPVLAAILITIFFCIGRPVKAVAVPAVAVPSYGYGVPAAY